jgi:large subunit ribosomal protein L10
MKKEEKIELVESLTAVFKENQNFYLADVSGLTVNETTVLRKLCYSKGITLKVSKNTFIIKALEKANITDEELLGALKGPSSVMISDSINGPAKLIKEFRKKHKKPVLKAAYVEDTVYVGEENLDVLLNLKTREELIADVVQLLKSPFMNLLSAIHGPNKISSLLKALSDRKEN